MNRAERKRRARKGKRGGWPLPLVMLVVVAGVAFAVWAFTIERPQGGAAGEDPPGVETFSSEGAEHVTPGTKIRYNTDPPTSGPHYPAPLAPGFYDRVLPAEALVHNLEHGHVVIYYDASVLTEEAIEEIRDLTERYSGPWDAVVAMPREDEEYPLILTAWTKMLRLRDYDEEAVMAFVDAYRGRGPENPVR